MRISLGPWTAEVDTEATLSAYASLVKGSSAECGCTDCQNWIEQREATLSPPFLAAITAMGIDPTKETEVSEYEGGHVVSDRNLYWGEYLFVGKVLDGPECYVEQPGGKGSIPQFVEVFPGVRMGVSSNTKWARVVPPFVQEFCSVVAFQVHTVRGGAYA